MNIRWHQKQMIGCFSKNLETEEWQMLQFPFALCIMHYDLNCCSLHVEYTMTKSMDAATGDFLE